MRPRARRRLRWFLAAFFAGFVLLNALAYNHVRAMTHYVERGPRTPEPERLSWPAKLGVLLGGVNVPRPESDLRPVELDPACRMMVIPAPPGVLSAWYVNRGPRTPLVVLLHGYAAEKTSLLPEARLSLELGASVLLVDFHGSGGSSGSTTTIGLREADDVAAVVGHARLALRHSSVVLFGQSMGAVAVLRAVQTRGIEPDAVILEAVFDTLLNTVRNRFRAMGLPSFPCAELLIFWGGRQWGFDGFSHNPMDYASSLRCPALFLHGTDDPRARIAEGRRVHAAVSSPKTFVEFADTRHASCAANHPAQWKAAVAALVARSEPHE